MWGRDEQKKGYIRRRKPARVDEILKRTLRHAGIEKQIARYRFVLFWNEIVGDEIAKRTKPELIRGHTLVVKVCSSVWANELTFQKKVLVSRLNRFLGGRSVSDIQFVVGAV